MQNALDGLLAALVAKLGAASPFAKAIGPAALAVADILVNLAISGSLDGTDLAGAGGALVAAVVAYLLPNKAHVPPYVAPPVRPAK